MKWFLPLLLWLALVPFTPTLDLAIESYFYQDGHFSTSPFLQFFYDYEDAPDPPLGWKNPAKTCPFL